MKKLFLILFVMFLCVICMFLFILPDNPKPQITPTRTNIPTEVIITKEITPEYTLTATPTVVYTPTPTIKPTYTPTVIFTEEPTYTPNVEPKKESNKCICLLVDKQCIVECIRDSK